MTPTGLQKGERVVEADSRGADWQRCNAPRWLWWAAAGLGALLLPSPGAALPPPDPPAPALPRDPYPMDPTRVRITLDQLIDDGTQRDTIFETEQLLVRDESFVYREVIALPPPEGESTWPRLRIRFRVQLEPAGVVVHGVCRLPDDGSGARRSRVALNWTRPDYEPAAARLDCLEDRPYELRVEALGTEPEERPRQRARGSASQSSAPEPGPPSSSSE